MLMTRRTFLKATAATTALSTRPTWAATEISLGQARIVSLSDGHLTVPAEFFFDAMPQDQLAPILKKYGLTGDLIKPPCNVTLLQTGNRNILFDVGAGPGFQDGAGKLPEALGAIDLTPEDITDVIFTHGHADHLWGALDDFDEPFFINARHMMGKAEWDYWWNPNTVNEIGAARQTMAVGAKRRLDVLEDRIELFDEGEEILSGVAARATPGHTLGHMSFELRSGSESLMIVGDALINFHVAFERPDWHSGSDHDQEMAAATRVQLLDQLASQHTRIIGFHLSHGGIGHVDRSGDAYHFVPLNS